MYKRDLNHFQAESEVMLASLAKVEIVEDIFELGDDDVGRKVADDALNGAFAELFRHGFVAEQ